MYLSHFGLTHYPFERALQSDELLSVISQFDGPSIKLGDGR